MLSRTLFAFVAINFVNAAVQIALDQVAEEAVQFHTGVAWASEASTA